MRNTSLAESILARFTTPERAASIVGDLFESTAPRGGVWFWFSVMRTALSLFGQRVSANRSELMLDAVTWVCYFLVSNLTTGWKWRDALWGATEYTLMFEAMSALINWRKRRRKRL